MNTPYSIYEIDQRKKLNTLSDFENQKPTPIGAAHAFSKIDRNFQKSISQGIGSKLQNQHDLLNQIQLFEIYKSPTQESQVDF